MLVAIYIPDFYILPLLCIESGVRDLNLTVIMDIEAHRHLLCEFSTAVARTIMWSVPTNMRRAIVHNLVQFQF